MSSNYDPTDLRGQQLDKQAAETRKRVVRDEEIADTKWLMSSRRGRRVMRRWLSLSRVFQISFNTNAMQMAFNEGKRNLGNNLLDEVMEHCPEQFPVMEREYREDGKRSDGNGDNQSN